MSSGTDNLLNLPIRIAYERFGLTPNQISTIGFAIGTVAGITVACGGLVTGLSLLAISQIIDGVDGGVARRYNLQSQRGRTLEAVYDRVNELSIFLALAYIGQVTYFMAIMAFLAILLVTLIEPKSKFDPGFKRFMLYFGYLATVLFHIRGFQIAMHVVFWANLIGFAAGTIMVDYRLQKEIDTEAIIRREREISTGVPQQPDDPPSLLSRLLS